MHTTDSPGNLTRTEILTQPAVWAITLGDLKARQQEIEHWLTVPDRDTVLFVGCGSTHYGSLALAAAFQSLTGLLARGTPASEVFLFPGTLLDNPARTWLVAMSRSGSTTETLRAIATYRQAGGQRVLGITCYGDSPVVAECDICLVAREAHEESVAQTRSLTAMMLTGLFCAGVRAADQTLLDQLEVLPDAGQALIDGQFSVAEELGQRVDLSQVFFLGSGPLYGVASEAMLKFKEMSLTVSQAFHSMEFRHGPVSMVDESTLIVGLLCKAAFEEELAVLQETKGLGATVLALVPGELAASCHGVDHVIPLAGGFTDPARLPLYLPPLQWLALSRALTKGLNPDRPRHLESVVYL